MPKKIPNKKTVKSADVVHITKEEFLVENDLDLTDLFELAFGQVESVEQVKPESEHAKRMRECGERVILRTKEDLENLLRKIEETKKVRGSAIDVKLEFIDGYDTTGSVFTFYIPESIYDLLIDYGFKDEVNRLIIEKPDFFEVGNSLQFNKNLILARGGEFIYSCSFKRSIINFFECTSIGNDLRWEFYKLIQILHNQNSDRNCCECNSENVIRNSEPVLIDKDLWAKANKKLFSELSMEGIRSFWNS